MVEANPDDSVDPVDPVDSVVVVGAGLMGSGIAQVTAASGRPVILRDVTDEALARGRAAIERSLNRFVDKGTLSRADADAALGRVTTTRDLGAVSEAGLVVEAVFESLDVKTELFRELDRLAPDGAVLATNTSAIPITRIAAATRRPEAVVGTHFFSPVPMMALCELVRGYKTSDETLASARTFAESVGKTCVVVNPATSRFISALAMEAIRLVENGVATAEDVDVACRLGFGHAMGPLATTDLTGVDILRNASQNIYDETHDEKFAPPELLNRMVSAGDLGRKSGQGFYPYDG
jgi:3-hydroxybutyryl-CoA dehydrogenase